MLRLGFAAAFFLSLAGTASSQSTKAFEGTWLGQLKSGTLVQVIIPAGGGAASYYYNNRSQGPQTVTVQGSKIRLDNTGGSTHLVLGPVKGKSLGYFWTDGNNTATTTLTKQ